MNLGLISIVSAAFLFGLLFFSDPEKYRGIVHILAFITLAVNIATGIVALISKKAYKGREIALIIPTLLVVFAIWFFIGFSTWRL